MKELLLADFNSIKVRLELSFLLLGGYLLLNFNSIKVRLEQDKVRKNATVCLFQFHKGTIRTKDSASSIGQIFHFNSIKVRLEPICKHSSLLPHLFQFHKGTIRTKYRVCPRFLHSPYFNSIKVRLELHAMPLALPSNEISIP